MFKIIKPIIAITILSLYIVIVFSPIILQNKMLVVGDFTGSDLIDMHYPYVVVLHNSYQSFSLPFWSFDISNGFPLFAEGQSGGLFPTHILFALLNPIDALHAHILSAFFIAGLGMYFYSSTLPRLKFSSAVLAALAFMGSSFFVARVKHVNMIEVGAILPWCLYVIRQYSITKKLRWLVLLVLFTLMQIFAGHPHMAYLSLMIVTVHYIVELVSVSKYIHINPIYIVQKMGVLLFVFFIAILLSLPQLLPTIELTMHSTRSGGSYLNSVAFPFNPVFYSTLFSPFSLGNPAVGNYDLPITKYGVWWENILYIGVLPSFFILFGLITKFHVIKQLVRSVKDLSLWTFYSRQSDYVRYLLSLFCAALIFHFIALGSFSIIYLVLYYMLPGFSLFRFPQRLNLYLLLVYSVFFAYCFQLFSGKFKKTISRLLFTFAILFLLIIDLSSFAFNYFSFSEKTFLNPSTEVLNTISDGKIYSLTQYFEGPYLNGWKSNNKEISSEIFGLPGDTPARFGVQSFSNRNWFEGGLALKDRVSLERDLLNSDSITCEEFTQVVGLFGVKYISIKNGSQLLYGSIPNLGSCAEKIDEMNDIVWYENKYTRPIAYVVSDLRKAKSIPELVHFSTEPFSDVDLIEFSDAGIYTEVESNSNEYLLLTQYYFPGWKVFVNGIQKSIIIDTGGLMSVELNSGINKVEWKYVPRTFYAGVIISCVTLLLSGIYLFINKERL